MRSPILFAVVFCIGLTLLAQENKPVPPPPSLQANPQGAQPKPDSSEEIIIKFGHFRMKGKRGARKLEVWADEGKSVTVAQEETNFICDRIIHDEETGKGECFSKSGRVKIEDPEGILFADKATFNTTDKIAVLTGNVELTYTPKKEESEDKQGFREEIEGKALVTCKELVYDYKNRIGYVKSGLTMKDEKRVVTADSAQFLRKEERAIFEGNVHYVSTDGDDMNCDKAELSLKKDDEWIYAFNLKNSKVKIETESEEKPKSDKKGGG
jgi:lipopolysaccharide assembly outer membrane protein LptD (OstA)